MADDLIAGAFGGIAKTLIAQPFDTMKVRRQCNISSPITFPGLYKGVPFPMISNTLFQGVSLAVQQEIQVRVKNHGLAGAITGAICCLFTCPLDSWKVAHQNRSPILLRNAYRGLGSAVLRESIASGAFFVSFGNLQKVTGNTTLAGALGGLTATLVSLPLDTVKTRLQAGQSLQMAMHQQKFAAGVHYVILKAVLTNAACYYVYGSLRNNRQSQNKRRNQRRSDCRV